MVAGGPEEIVLEEKPEYGSLSAWIQRSVEPVSTQASKVGVSAADLVGSF